MDDRRFLALPKCPSAYQPEGGTVYIDANRIDVISPLPRMTNSHMSSSEVLLAGGQCYAITLSAEIVAEQVERHLAGK